MATETTNLKLNKPDKTDFYNIDLVNDNMDKIDKAIGNKANKTDIPTKLPANGGNADTVGGKHVHELTPKAYLVANGVDLFEYIESLTDEQFPPISTVIIRAFNCINSPIDGKPYKVDPSKSNGGDFIVEVTRLETKDWYVLFAKELHANKIFRGGKRDGTWRGWELLNDLCTLPDGADITSYVVDATKEDNFTMRSYRILNGSNVPTNYGYTANNNDFCYTAYKVDNSWIRLIAYDVRSNREFVNSKLGGNWTGWQSMADITTLVTFTNSKYVSASEYTCIKLGNYLVCTAKITVQNITSTGWVPLLQFPSGMTAYKNSSFALTNFNTIIRDGFVTNNEIRGHMNTSDNGKFFTGSFIAQLK